MAVDQHPTSQAPGPLPPELMHMLATASRETTVHVEDRGLCMLCVCSWPCERAVVLAEHTLAAL